MLTSCTTTQSVNSNIATRPTIHWTLDQVTETEKRKTIEFVISRLKDPESARFAEIWALQGSNGNRSICGLVNAKNSYGGYTGMKNVYNFG